MTTAVTEPARRRIEFRPQPGFQERFCATSADIAIGGGAAGAGKSWAEVFEPIRHHKVNGFSAIIFRRTSPELTGPESLWEESKKLYPYFRATPRSHRMDWRFPSGATVQLSHLQYEDDVEAHHGKGYCLIEIDELCSFLESQFWYMLSRNRSTCGVHPYFRATCNPDPDSFVARLIEWWIDQETGYPIPEHGGVVRWLMRVGEGLHWADHKEELLEKFSYLPPEDVQPKSITFIPGKLEDNKILMRKDPSYRANLLLLPHVLQERLLRSNWKIKAGAGSYFPRGKWEIVDKVPENIVSTARAWDKAATKPSEANPDPSWTAGVKMGQLDNGKIIVLHVERDREDPAGVDAMMRRTAEQDGREITVAVFQDPGQAGKVDLAHMLRVLAGFDVEWRRPCVDKETAAGPFSSQVLGDKVMLLRGAWNEPYISEHENFPKGKKNDQVDASGLAYDLVCDADDWELV